MNFVKFSFTLLKMNFNQLHVSWFPGIAYKIGRIRFIEYVTTRIYRYFVHQHRMKHLQNRESDESQTVPQATDRKF